MSENGSARTLPEAVHVSASPRFTPNQLRALQAATGMHLEQVMSDPANVMQAAVWLQLQRDGYRDATWDEAGDVYADLVEPDPTSPPPPTPSPHSVASGA